MASNDVCEFTDDNFDQDVRKSDIPVLVDLWAEWCMPCRAVGPTIEALAGKFSGRVKVGKMDVDANRNVSSELGIQSIPTIILFNNGEAVRTFVGVTAEEAIAQELEKLVG